MSKFDVIIIGSGPAGYTAGIYLGRALVKHALFSGNQPGGQLTTTTTVENFPGFAEPILGPELMENMAKQTQSYGTNIIAETITKINPVATGFELSSNSNVKHHAKAVIIATGASAKWLGLKSEQDFIGFGVSACATCDGFFFKGKDVIVIGGANTAVEEASYLANICNSVTIVYRGAKLRAEAWLLQKLNKLKNVTVLYHKELQELVGEDNPKNLTGAKLIDNQTNQVTEIECAGCFIAIGHRPNTENFKNLIKLDKAGYVVVDYPLSSKTSHKGIFAAGDVQDSVYRQAVTAAGSGCIAAIDTIKFLKQQS